MFSLQNYWTKFDNMWYWVSKQKPSIKYVFALYLSQTLPKNAMCVAWRRSVCLWLLVFRRNLLPLSPRSTTSQKEDHTVNMLFSSVRTYSLVLWGSIIWLKPKIHATTWPACHRVFIFFDKCSSLSVTFPPRFCGRMNGLRSYEGESTGNKKWYLSNKTRNLYITTYVQFKMLCFKQYRFLNYHFCHIVDGQAVKQ